MKGRSVRRIARRATYLVVVLAGVGGGACQTYTAGVTTAPVFLSGRLVGPNGAPPTRCDAGVEEDGEVATWRPVDSEFREMFLLPPGRATHRIVIQCRGYLEHAVEVASTGTQWRVGGVEYRANQTVPLGIVVLRPG